MEDMLGVKHCYCYFPVLIDEDKCKKTRDQVYKELKKDNIYGRRYFYPLISQFPPYRGLPSVNPANLIEAEKITKQVLCLPIYPELNRDCINHICTIIKGLVTKS